MIYSKLHNIDDIVCYTASYIFYLKVKHDIFCLQYIRLYSALVYAALHKLLD